MTYSEKDIRIMIDEDRTLQLFGRGSDALTRESYQVVVVCEGCGKYRVMGGYGKIAELCRGCAKKLYMTDETKRKISEYQKTTVASSDTRQKMSISQKKRPLSSFARGEKSGGWKGGVSPWRNALTSSVTYKNWRTAVFKHDNYTCQMCNEHGGRLEAHHIHPVRDHKNDLSIYDVNNGITLCKRCHNLIRNHEHEFIDQFKEILER